MAPSVGGLPDDRLEHAERILAQHPRDLGVAVAQADERSYRLTARGQELAPVICAVATWAEKWLPLEESVAPSSAA